MPEFTFDRYVGGELQPGAELIVTARRKEEALEQAGSLGHSPVVLVLREPFEMAEGFGVEQSGDGASEGRGSAPLAHAGTKGQGR